MADYRPKALTYRMRLPGGQERLRELILYVADKCQNAPRFGMIKLNKIIWRADFSAFAARHVPVTGRAYQKLKYGPAPVDMRPLLEEMRAKGDIEIDSIEFKLNVAEKRVVAILPPNPRYFSADDLEYVDASIAYYWNKTGELASEDSHGTAWATRDDGDPMPYELAFLSDAKLNTDQAAKFSKMAEEYRWASL
jgi:antitoxin SocA-like protein